jgi:hypothetical protein
MNSFESATIPVCALGEFLDSDEVMRTANDNEIVQVDCYAFKLLADGCWKSIGKLVSPMAVFDGDPNKESWRALQICLVRYLALTHSHKAFLQWGPERQKRVYQDALELGLIFDSEVEEELLRKISRL